MKISTIHSIRLKFISVMALLLTAANMTMAQTGNWSSYKASGYDSGSGTQSDPYIIKTAEQLAYYASRITSQKDQTAYVELGDHIDLQGHWWVPIGSNDSNNPNVFKGSFDGKGYFISNMKCDWGAYQNSGLFGFLQGGKVKNIIIEDATFTARSMISSGARRVGVVAGGTRGNPVIENIIVRNSKINLNSNFTQSNGWILVGGIVGGNYNDLTIANCYVDVDIDMTKFTSYSANGLKQSWFAQVLGATEGNSQPVIKNVYSKSTLKVLSDLNYTSIGTIIGENQAKNKDAVVGSNCYYENVPTTADGTPLTHAIISGTKSSSFSGTGFLGIANEYANADNTLEKWRTINGNQYFSKLKLKVSESYTAGSKETTYKLYGIDASYGTIKWSVDGNDVTPDEGTNSSEITIPLYNKTRQGQVAITIDGTTEITKFAILPKYYTQDGLYAASYAGGKGTKADPYLIENDLQLARLAYEVNKAPATQQNTRVFGGLYFKLTKDIDLSAAIWTPIGGTTYKNNPIFAGKFLGNSHTVSNMRIVWTDQSGVWSTWGMFAQLYGQSANEASFCSVSDLIIDNASLEKAEGYVPVGNGMNLGILVGEVNPFSELSNIIVKNSVITDHEETYSRSMEWQIGGIVANVNGSSNSNIFRIFNLSTDTRINMLKNANVSNRKVWIGGAFGGLAITSSTQSYSITPTNIYVHADVIDTNTSVSTQLKRGGIAASTNSTIVNNWYYTDDIPGSDVTNYGVKKSLSEWAKNFIIQNNTFIQDNTPADSCIWTYSKDNGFAFGNTVLTLDRTDGDIITATTPGKDGTERYYWYVSQDRKTWTQVMQADGNTPLLQHTLSLPYQSFDLYVYATLEDQTSSSQIIKVEKLTFKATLSEDKGTYTVNVSNNIWNNNDKFNITYQWKKNGSNDGTNSDSYTPSNPSANDKISCEVTVKDKNNNDTIYHNIIFKATVVYLCPAGVTASDGTSYLKGEDKDDADWGYSPDKPMLTWRGAYSKLEKDASWTENVIVLMGTSNKDVTNNPTTGFNILENTRGGNYASTATHWQNVLNLNSPLFRNTTITGSWDNVNYNGQIEVGGDMNGLHIFGDTRFEDVTFNHVQSSYDIIYCQYNSLEMGEGVVMTNYNASSQGYETVDGSTVNSVQIFGGFLNDGRFYPLDNAENIKKFEESMPHGKEGFSITLKSGHYSTICAGGRQASGGNQNGVMGTPNLPVKCTITIDINRNFNDQHNDKNASYDVGTVLAGNHEGAMYGDVDIIVRSGTVARVVNGTLGNQRPFVYSAPYNPPFNTYMGRANILIDPASSEYAQKGEPLATTNERVVVTEVYGGSLGRGFESGKSIDNPFYGISTVTINGGTFKILPESNANNANVLSGIYGAGAGGMTGIGDDDNHTPDDRIAYWNSSKDVMLYGDYNTAKGSLIHYQCYNADTQTTTDVDPTETKTNVIINGGVFGTEAHPLDGIYAGGSGYMSPGLWYTSGAIPNTNGGNVYGKSGKAVASLTINGGTFYCTNGIFAGGRGTDKFFTTNSLNNKTIGGNRADYKELGKTYGNVELNINNGTFHCSVYGGGYGVADSHQYGRSDNSVETLTNMARIYGKSTVNIYGGTFYKNIYGGGDMALVDYSGEGVATNVNISDSTDIRGSVFGGGNGRPYLKQKTSATSVTISDAGTEHPELVGRVTGGTSVSFIGDTQKAPYIYGDIYGGGNLAQVEGDTYVNFYAGNFAGKIFGGGKGLLNAETQNTSADITGNTYVALAQDPGGQEDGDDGEKIDNFSINVIWNQLWDEGNNQFYVWDSETGSSVSKRDDNTSREKVTVDKARFYDEGKFLNSHNIYGGGNVACNVGGTATVSVQKGTTPFSLLKTSEWKASYGDNNNPHFYVFGGGYGENTSVGNTIVTVDVEGDYGIYNAEAGDGDEQLAKPNNGSLFDGSSSSGNDSSFDGVSTPSRKKRRSARKAQASTTIPVFDNSKGIPNFTILGVLGGGYSGIVTGDAKVTVDGNTFIHRVYGGGFGDPTSTADNTTGQVQGNTEVYVKGANIYGDVFGGGAGVSPLSKDATPFKTVAEVLGTTKVEISDDAKVYGKVYGGGDIANVGEYQETKPAGYYDQSSLSSVSTLDQDDGSFISYEAKGYKTFVNIVGGDVFGNVYGGGKGLTKAKATYYDQVGRINGNTLVHIANSDANNAVELLNANSGIAGNAIDPNGNNVPNVWNRIYGGCAYGTVDGNTLIHIEGGMLGLNIFGGGYGDVSIDNDDTDDGSGMSTPLTTLEQVLGKKDTGNEGTYANILGNTKVQIDGGSWLWNKRADVNGNITTWVGAEDGKNKICDGLDDFKHIVAAIKAASSIDEITDEKAKAAINTIKNDKDTQMFFDLENGLFKKNHNIFGGGNRACYVGTYTGDTSVKDGTGTAVVEINHSPLADIYDSNGNLVSMLDNTTLQGLCWYIASNSKEHPQFSVFGAGYGANTKVANTKVYVRPGAYMKDDGDHLEVAGLKFRYRNQAADMEKYMEHETGFYSDFMKVSKEDKKLYYGSSDGGNADGTDNDNEVFVRYRASRMAWMLGTPNFTFFEIHGGGFSGYVTGDTYVETDNHLDCRNIFGAGLGAQPYGTFDSNAKYDFGSIGGNAKVFMKAGNVSDNVYGGGAGIESARINGKEFTDFSSRTGEAFDFPDMARVNGKTEVHIYGRPIITAAFKFDRTLIFGSVYGGGDVANVGNSKAAAAVLKADDYMTDNAKFTSLVNIRGAKVFSHIFAGGNGRKKSECADYTKLGGIYGNACVVLDRPVISYPYLKTTGTATSSSITSESLDPSLPAYMAHPADDVNPGIYPITLNRIYGGCQNGTVYGNTLVAINGGRFLSNIFAGGWGACDTLQVNNSEEISLTSADVTGNTNMFITGGEMGFTAYWHPDERTWEPAEIIGGKTYSPQYDHSTLKFKVNHNTYGGGNLACVVGEKDANGKLVDGSGNTYITIKKGLLYDTTPILSGQDASLKFFESDEWKEVYEKIGSPHFGLFGGGYGENTNILGDTHIDIDMASRGSIQDHNMDIKEGEEYKHFLSGYSVMDVIGGGYSGKVEGETHIYGDGGVFCRRVFGGGFYNSVSSTNIDIKAIDCHDIFGGGLMGDIMKTTNVNIGRETADATSTYSNADIFIHGNVYGANDVSGYVNVVLDEQGFFADNGGKGTNINIYGGNITGNVYGAGNGDYLYALDKEGHDKVTVNEYYPINPNDPESEKVDLVYTVPMRDNMPSYKAASDAAKIVNINSWRPMTNKVNILIKGVSESDTTVIKGDVYGGGNSATVQKVQQSGVRANNTVGEINLNIGSHVRIGRVFMGCNGDALFTASEDNDFMNKFQRLNGDIEDYTKELNLADSIDWQNDPSNKGISTLWLSTRNEQRHIVYPHLLDLYFQPVETDIQGTLKWNGTEEGTTLTDCVIGTFCCGGNRGNMNVYPKTADDYTADTPADNMKIGNVFEYTFPAGLTITDKIVGGCNNANYDYKGKVEHEGGYLLGEIHSKYPFIKLNIKNKFQPAEREGAYVGGNVYGGCFRTGTIRGDVSVVLESDMLKGKEKEKLEKSNELLSTNAEYSALNVYGAGYGMESYVYGNCYVKMGKGIKCSAPTTSSSDGVSTPSQAKTVFNPSGTSANFIYGGGQQGNVIGKTDVKVLNGHVFKSVTGGSYSGFLWGSTQVRIGFPKYYVVNAGCGGMFSLNRADQNNKDIDKDKKVASETIKQSLRIINDDIITQAVYNAINGRYNFETNSYEPISDEQKPTFFKVVAEDTPSVGWDNVNIVIGEAVYGGGYSLAHGSSAMGDNTTVLKYDKTHNLDDGFETDAERNALKKLGGTTIGYAGNTTILIGDRTKAQTSSSGSSSSSDGVSTPSSTTADRDHITISRQDMKVAAVADGQDLLGYYYKDKDGKYHYIYQAGTYYKGGSVEAGTLPKDMVGSEVYQYDNEGGIFGDGHLSYTQGFRSADLTGYGFASTTVKSPKILNTFQRMDILRLTDNCFTLLGARDYATNAMDKTPYSISRVGEIQMIANNVLNDADSLANSSVARSRNYMGFANNVHYLGGLTSNVDFNESWFDEYGKPGSYEGASTYQTIKQKYIDDYYKGADGFKGNTHIFEKRNNGTARNMIGIASGYALKLLNVQELVTANDAIEEKLYYGPIYGVIEMNLIDVREDEGGGYVYADNVHKRTAAEGETAHDVDFLETTGNFVFPYSPKQGRYIVDDCFPKSYESLSAGDNPDDKIEAHYWYVTGFNYHYTAHITGFTFDSSELNPQYFSSNNTDGIVALSGLKAAQKVNVIDWRTYCAHDAAYECDLEKRNYQEGSDVKGKYVLNVGAANSESYIKPLAEGETAPTDAEKLPGFAANLSLEEGKNDVTVLKETLPTQFTGGDARIVFQLTDMTNNSTTEYYNKHLSQPCKGSLILSAQALDNTGNQITGNISISSLYTQNANGTYTKVSTGKLDANTEYFYKSGETNLYQTTEGKQFSYIDPQTGDTVNVSKTDVELGTNTIYYCKLDRYYTYTIDLTIDYVQGPDIEGNITVENCALPGELVRLKKDKVKINADQAFSVNGYYWRIGKRHEVNGEWTFDDATPWSKYTTANGYDTFNQLDKEGTGLFAGCHYDKTEDYLDVPVYYFMNGYGIQLGVTMNVPGLDDILPVKMIEADKLTVHNYQRMNSQRTGIDLHLAEAIKRAKDDSSFAEPRIYISNQSDLASFIQFVDSVGTNCDAPRYGANAQFVLQNDVTMPSSGITLPADFAGTLHGNGHVINGIEKGNALFNSVSGNIYNLGLSSGKISAMQPTGGKIANYHCCFEYAPEENKSSFDGVSTPSVYRMDGTLDTHYTTEDFRLGRVAYDLNEYYLRARYSNETDDDKAALKYVYDYFANGDYQYANRTDAITGKFTGITYLRTGKDSDLPNYEQAETRHDRTHAIDKPRAQQYVAATADAPEQRTGDYLPLFNANSADGSVTGTEMMNDFLFWGQALQSTPASYPSEIASHELGYMTNRVYRAAGYYGDTTLDAYHYNAYYRGNNNMGTFVHDPATTAIDFTCQNDLPKALGMNGSGIFYAPLKDNATTFFDFTVKDGVTKNLLVYTDANSDDMNNDTEAYDVVSKSLSYNEATRETLINGHHIVETSQGDATTPSTFSTALLHLVERTPEGQNSEGDLCDNNNLCVPIPFTVTNHAWYIRKPLYYAEANTGAWEGICLPFTVHEANASLNGEITHFYGMPTDEEKADPAKNTHTLHHEYWLRGLMSVATDSGKQSAVFQRPGAAADGLFAPTAADGTSSCEGVSYTFANSFFTDTYESWLYNKTANPYYAESHVYDGYLPQAANVPYIVRFPGQRYYEFDLSNKFYNNLLGRSEAAQTITFNAYGPENTNNESFGTVTIPVTGDMSTSLSNYSHKGTFSATDVAEGSIYGMNAEGTAFDDASALKTVMPFRTYMATNASGAKSRSAAGSEIFISEPSGIDEITPDLTPDGDEDADESDRLIIRPIGDNKVRIESTVSTTLSVYTTAGQLYKVLDVHPGTAVYDGFQSGTYIFGGTKVIVSK